jgi:hypothetical protein
MRYLLAIVALVVTALCLLSPASHTVGMLRGQQQPTVAPELSPKLLAFLKPIEPAAGDSELQQKLKERHNVAVKLLELRVTEYKKGVRDIAPVFDAARIALDAKLDLDPSAKARIAVLEQSLELARQMEGNLQQQIDKGFGSKGDLERAKFARLTVEVELIKAKQKDGAK